jgi:hypothetical protein
VRGWSGLKVVCVVPLSVFEVVSEKIVFILFYFLETGNNERMGYVRFVSEEELVIAGCGPPLRLHQPADSTSPLLKWVV